MSTTGDYMLILGMDQPERGTPEKEVFDKGLENGDLLLDDSTEHLSILIDKVNWDGDEPTRKIMDSCLVYYWSNTIGPYYKDGDVFPPVERLIEKTKQQFPNLDKHYSKVWWCEGDLYQREGEYLNHNGPTTYTTVYVETYSSGKSGCIDIRDYFTSKL